MGVAKVVVANRSRELDKVFHYRVPDGLAVQPGARVLVPFGRGNRTAEGIVIGFAETSDVAQTKDILQVLDELPLCTPQLIDLALWMRNRYLCTYYQALKTVMPSGISLKTTRWVTLIHSDADVDKLAGRSQTKRAILTRLKEGGTMDVGCFADLPSAQTALNSLAAKGVVSLDDRMAQQVKSRQVRMASLLLSPDQCGEQIAALHRRAPKQAAILELLRQTGELSVADLAAFSGGSYQTVRALEQKGFVAFRNQTVLRQVYREQAYEATRPLPPTAEQAEALSALCGQVDRGDLTPVLLRGVTGSGKTEVFLQLIDHVLKKGKQAIVLVPEISLTPQMVQRFVGRFGNRVSVLHSGLSLGERYDEWMKIRTGQVSVAVGARSAVFAPFDRLGVVIVDEEHETTYKSDQAPHYDAREVALRRGSREGALVLMGSATPSIASYYRAQQGRYRLMELRYRYNMAQMPAVTVVDMRRELERGNRSPFSARLYGELVKNMEAGQQSILFLNRRGFNSFVLCRDCGQPVTCRNCSISMTYHKRTGQLKCHYCGYEQPNVTVCPSCGSSHIRFMGTGTEKLEEELARRFGPNSFVRMDADTTGGKNAHQAILDRFQREQVPILLGTQMVTKGLDFPNVTLVGVMAADLTLNMDDFRAAERTFSQLTQVCGRAGRGDLAGRAVIQTYQPDHYAVVLAQRQDYPAFYESELAIRKQLEHPPFCDMIVLMVQGADLAAVTAHARQLGARLRQGGYAVLGPGPAPYGKIKNQYRWRIIVKHPDARRLLPMLRAMLDDGAKGETQLNIEINPNSMN